MIVNAFARRNLAPASSLQVAKRGIMSSTRLQMPYFISSYNKSPQPTESVPDVQTFLNKIGRGLNEYSEKFESWDELVGSNGESLKEKGIDVRQRR